MSDLVERLRNTRPRNAFYKDDTDQPINPDGPEAADRIAQLEAEVMRLRSSVLACLGYWRDEMPDDAVAGFQQALQETADGE